MTATDPAASVGDVTSSDTLTGVNSTGALRTLTVEAGTVIAVTGTPARLDAFLENVPEPVTVTYDPGTVASMTVGDTILVVCGTDLSRLEATVRAAEQMHAATVAVTFPSNKHDKTVPSVHRLRRFGFSASHRIGRNVNLQLNPVPAGWDHRHVTHFDVIGDIHGCFNELLTVVTALGYDTRFERGRWRISHPENRTLILTGDVHDRGPRNLEVLTWCADTAADGVLTVASNHSDKLLRYLDGLTVSLTHGLDGTVAELASAPPDVRDRIRAWLAAQPTHLLLDDGHVCVAHAGLPEHLQGRSGARVKQTALWGPTAGRYADGTPRRADWAGQYSSDVAVIYGHHAVNELRWRNNTLCVDTGACAGGGLSAVSWPEKTTVTVDSGKWADHLIRSLPADERARPVRHVNEHALRMRARTAGLVDATMFASEVTTRSFGTVRVHRDRIRSATNDLFKSGVGWRNLCWLPHTIAPVGSNPDRDVLEHPADAFTFYKTLDVASVHVEAKHMGSRVTFALYRDNEARTRRVGSPGELVVGWSRNGRQILTGDRFNRVAGQLRDAVLRAGWFDEVDWVLLDGELMPWNVKAQQLIEDLFEPVGVAAPATLSTFAQRLSVAHTRIGDDISRRWLTNARHDLDLVDRFDRIWRPFTGDPNDIQVGLFAVPAFGDQVTLDCPRDWHHRRIRDLAGCSDGLIVETGHVVVDLSDDASMAAGVAFFEQVCASGGEGVVVKPSDGLVPVLDARPRLGPPMLKVRGPEFLQVVYGPGYLSKLSGLRNRPVKKKRRLSALQWALSHDALERFCAGEPAQETLIRVAAAVAVGAEPVDARL